MEVFGWGATWEAVMTQGVLSSVSLDLGKSMKARTWRSSSAAVLVLGSSWLSALLSRRE